LTDSTPSWNDVIDRRIGAALRDVHTAMPARVESYDESTGRASVQPLIKYAARNDLGVRVPRLLPIVPSVPIVFPGGGGGGVTFSVTAGDIVLMVVSEVSLDRWLAGDGRAVDPADPRRHCLTDALALPWYFNTGGPVIAFTATEIRAGGTEALALQSDLAALASWVEGLPVGGTGSAVVPGAPAGTGTTVLKGG
jgi:hypothetical protein